MYTFLEFLRKEFNKNKEDTTVTQKYKIFGFNINFEYYLFELFLHVLENQSENISSVIVYLEHLNQVYCINCFYFDNTFPNPQPSISS